MEDCCTIFFSQSYNSKIDSLDLCTTFFVKECIIRFLTTVSVELFCGTVTHSSNDQKTYKHGDLRFL